MNEVNSEFIPVKAELINGELIQTVDARQLHRGLESPTKFADWIKRRIRDARLQEGRDFKFLKFKKCHSNGKGSTIHNEYTLSLDGAKHIAMLENNDMGFKVRDYFITYEKEFRKQRLVSGDYGNRLKHVEDATSRMMDIVVELTSIIKEVIHHTGGVIKQSSEKKCDANPNLGVVDPEVTAALNQPIYTTTTYYSTYELSCELRKRYSTIMFELQKQTAVQKVGMIWELDVAFIQCGYGGMFDYVVRDSNGNDVKSKRILWTEKGREFVKNCFE